VEPARAVIAAPGSTVPLNAPVTLSVGVPGESLALARIVWEARDQQPAFGPTYTISPRNSGPQWVEAEVEWPDGRRAFAADSFEADSAVVAWVDGAVPAGAVPSSGGDGWNWVEPARRRAPAPLPPVQPLPGLHEHGFTGAARPSRSARATSLCLGLPRPGPSAHGNHAVVERRLVVGAPRLLGRQHDHLRTERIGRAPSRGRPAAAGRWVQLRVPARAVGLEGSTLSGMSFSLVGRPRHLGRRRAAPAKLAGAAMNGSGKKAHARAGDPAGTILLQRSRTTPLIRPCFPRPRGQSRSG
jgi:hypothetical protein